MTAGLAVIKSAEDLFGGAGNAKALAAAAAFDAVGITTGTGTGKPPVDPPVQGTQYVALIDAQTGSAVPVDHRDEHVRTALLGCIVQPSGGDGQRRYRCSTLICSTTSTR